MTDAARFSAMHTDECPEFIAFGEALTDLLRLDADRWTSTPGGAPWNLARAIACFGISSAFGGAISRDCFGDALWQKSEAAGLDLRFLQRVGKSPLLAIVHETKPPHYFFVGDDSADLYFDTAVLPRGWERAVRWAHFGGISLAREPLAGRLVLLAEWLKQQGVRISYDPNYRIAMTQNYDRVLGRMAAIADLIKVSEEDLRGLFRTDDEDSAFCQLRRLNPDVPILFTKGHEGASLHLGDEVWSAAPPQIDVVDTIGAGDCSLAGLLYSILRQPDAGWDTHLRMAVAAGAGACLAPGATPTTLAVLDRLLTEVQPRRGY